MSPISTTHMMLILPSDYLKIWKEKHADVKPTSPFVRISPNFSIGRIRGIGLEPLLRFAEIRKTSGRVGEVRHRYLDDIGSITLTEEFTTQKRWYKAMIAYNEKGRKAGRPQVEFLYFFIDPWILTRLMKVAERQHSEDKK